MNTTISSQPRTSIGIVLDDYDLQLISKGIPRSIVESAKAKLLFKDAFEYTTFANTEYDKDLRLRLEYEDQLVLDLKREHWTRIYLTNSLQIKTTKSD